MIRPAIRPIADQTDVALVLGRGGHAAVVVDALHAVGAVVLGALDDDPDPRAATPPDVTRLGRLDDLDAVLDAHPEITLVHAAVGDPHTRERWLARIDDARLRPIVHPSAVVSPSATLGAACF
ncbi:MAG: hypothetical protein KDA25_01430, partial [Phycisphaerales bacterium]|nr:hypothetical protein [Phycisphaerales bacterium]